MKNLAFQEVLSIYEEEVKNLTADDIKAKYGSDLEGNPSVYCGTYGKYNDGSLFGYQKQNTIKSSVSNRLNIS